LEEFLRFWLSLRSEEKKVLLERSWNLAKRSLQLFDSAKSFHQYATTYNQLSVPVALSVEHDGNLRSRVRKLREATEHGRRTVAILQSAGDKTELTKALIRASIFLDALADDSSDKVEQRECRRESRRDWDEAFKISRTVALHEITHPLHGFQVLDPSRNLQICEEALRIVTPKRDNFAIARLMDFSAKWTFYAAESSAGGNPTVSAKHHVKALHCAEEADRHYSIINFTSPIAGVVWAHSPYTEHFLALARYEADVGKRALLEEKGLRCAPELLRLAQRSGVPRVLFYAMHNTSKAEVTVATRERSRQRQKRLLARALSRRTEMYQMMNQVFSSTSWNRGATIRGLADVQSSMAQLEEDRNKKSELLVEAIRNQKRALRSALVFMHTLEQSGHHFSSAEIGRYYYGYGELWSRLWSITKISQYVRKAARAYATAAEWYEKIPRYDRSAECYWKSAEAYDRLQAHSVASESFALASNAYTKFGRQVPSLAEHSQDYARYLKAWTKIELARSLHLTQQFELAAKSYKTASNLHKLTTSWRILAPYSTAWSKLESGESLSRKSHYNAAIGAFREAAAQFLKSKVSMNEQLSLLDQPDERMMIEKLANSTRDSYCLARTSIEEAMMAEADEDHRTSFEKFGLSRERLNEISGLAESEEERREAAFLSILCEAWQLVSKAEFQNSTEPLQKAAILFERAKKLSPNEKSLKLALGHEAFCEALIDCRRFADALDPAFHHSGSRSLELAEEYYLDAGFKTAGYYARARKLLLNASLYLNSANATKDQRRRTTGYQLADTLLHESATQFLRARQPVWRKRVQTLLEKTRTESRIFSRLSEILTVASDPSTNAAFSIPTHGEEKAVGLERFGRADIEARLVSVTVGLGSRNDVELEIAISNTGKEPIRLLRLDEVVPEGADLVGAPQAWKDQGRSLTHGTQLIAPTKTETLKLAVRPRTDGLLSIRPKVVFIDENGLQWERLINAKIVATSRIMEFLACSFAKDNASRLPLERCGWKTMMEIVKALKIPRSHVYGEPRYGRTFGRQLDLLIKSSLVEYRIFPRERGRGGNVTRVRILIENERVRKYVEDLPAIGTRVNN